MTWGLKRQIFYVIVLLLFVTVFAFIILYPTFNKAPSCIDGKQNGNETGIDCGGSCANACLSQVSPLKNPPMTTFTSFHILLQLVWL